MVDMLRIISLILSITCVFLLWRGVSAADLVSVYQRAELQAPALQTEKAKRNAALEALPIAVSALLPQMSITATLSRADVESSGSGGSATYTTRSYVGSLTQTLFNVNTFSNMISAWQNSDAAGNTYQFDAQSFMINVSQAYLNVLQAQDDLKYAVAKVTFLKRTLKEAKEKYKVGLTSIVDLKQAEASYYQAIADKIKAADSLEDAREALKVFTGETVGHLAGLKADFPFTQPMPNQAVQWEQQAIRYNRSLVAAEDTADSRYSTAVAMAGYQLPQVNLQGSYTRSYYENDVPAAVSSRSRVADWAVGIYLTWNIFDGGALWANTRQAAKNYAVARASADLTYRQVKSNALKDYLAVETSVAQVKAFKQAVAASDSSLKQYEAKYAVGSETIVGVLNQLQSLYSAQQKLAAAQYHYIIAFLTLEQVAGRLTIKNLVKVNQWLQTKVAAQKINTQKPA